MDSPGWDFLKTIKKISPKQRYCILALANNATTHKELENQAGMFGAPGLTKEVKLFWRNMAYKIITEQPYRSTYLEELDSQYKKNENTGKLLQLSHLKFRARSRSLAEFLRDLYTAVEEGRN